MAWTSLAYSWAVPKSGPFHPMLGSHHADPRMNSASLPRFLAKSGISGPTENTSSFGQSFSSLACLVARSPSWKKLATITMSGFLALI